MTSIINNELQWDGSSLGSYPKSIIINKWTHKNTKYYSISLPQGIIYCNALRTKDRLPCIIEELKGIFKIPRRGLHHIIIENYDYLIYYVPISDSGTLLWETPLNRLAPDHELRRQPDFFKSVQKLIIFCDLLALSDTDEDMILIRHSGTYFPININQKTSLLTFDLYDYSIIPDTLFNTWFDEDSSIPEIVGAMVNYERGNDLPTTTMHLRSQIESAICKFDSEYIWYSNFILDRITRQLLNL